MRYPVVSGSALVASLLALVSSASAATPVVKVGALGRVPARATPATLERAARELVAREVRAGAELGAARVRALASGERAVHLGQRHQGVPVLYRGATVVFAKDGAARLATASLEPELPASTVPTIDGEEAARVASRATGLPADASRAHLVVWPGPDGARLAWGVDPVAVVGVARRPVVLVDAATGALLVRWDAAVHAAQAEVYPTNPVASPTLEKVTLPVTASSTTLESDLVVSKNCIDRNTTKSIMGLTVHTCELEQKALADANGDWLIPPGGDTDAEDAFSEVSMFHHASRAYAFFRAFDPQLELNGGEPLPTVSNLRVPQGFDTFDTGKLSDPNLPLAPFQNAFFAPENPIFSTIFGLSGGAMWFGQGPMRDYSYDGDVVYHELTHAVVEATLQLVGTPHMDAYGASFAPGAMNEGLADFFSSAIAGDSKVGEYAVGDLGLGTSIRDLASADACPAQVGGEVHQDSVMFSGALWDVRKTLGNEQQAQFDAAVFAAMTSSSSGDLGYEDFAKLVAASLEASPLGKAVADAQNAAFTARGLLPMCTRVLEWKGTMLNGPADLHGLWMTPGTSTTGVKAKDGGWTPGVVQVHAKLGENAAKLAVSFRKVDVGGGGAGPFGGGGTPFTPKLLVRFGSDPIQVTYKPLAVAEGTQLVELEGDKTPSAELDVPVGAADVYVMVVNAGQNDGAYRELALDVTPVASAPDAGAPDDAGADGAVEPGTGEPTGDDDASSSGGCAAGRGPASGGAAGALGLALAAVIASVRSRVRARRSLVRPGARR